MMLERDVDKLLHRACAWREIACVKVASISNRGLPDRLLIGPGRRFGFVEVKRTKGKLTGLQRAMLDTLEAAGVWCRVLTGCETRQDTLHVIEALLDDYAIEARP